MFKVGDIVQIKPEYRDTGEDACDYAIVEPANAMDRVQIAPLNWPWPIVPVELVAVYMVERA
jgi:hypothetical protein